LKTLIYAHRGASAYQPENTIEAFAKAIEQNADAVELDVHLSKDGRIIVAHDYRLERVSDGTGFLCDYTLEELKLLNFGILFPQGPVCRVPALDEVYDLLKQSSMIINVELKTTERSYPGLPEKLVNLTKEFKMEERIIYSSFNHYSLMEIKKLNPSAKTGLLYNIGMVDPWIYANYLKADAIHPQFRIIGSLPETVNRCHENGIKVNVWTVDDPQDINLMLEYGVDGIISNKPDLALKCRDEYN